MAATSYWKGALTVPSVVKGHVLSLMSFIRIKALSRDI